MRKQADFLDSAVADLEAILTYVARESGSLVARRFIAGLRQRCHELAALPGTMGRARPELRPDIRSIVHKGYVIFFRYVGARFEVVNILHGRRDIEAFFDEEPSA